MYPIWQKEGKLAKKGFMANLHATYFDAKEMYDFMINVICKEIPDITLMCEPSDYYRLHTKPIYEGDYLTQMFDWNTNS